MNNYWKASFLRLLIAAIFLIDSFMWLGAPPAHASSLATFIEGLLGSRDSVASPLPAIDVIPTPKRRSQVGRHKPEPIAVAKAADIINDKLTSSVPQTTPGAKPPLRLDTAKAPAVGQPMAANVKANLSSSPTSATSGPRTAIPIGPASKINDLPVTPLE